MTHVLFTAALSARHAAAEAEETVARGIAPTNV